MISLAEHRQGAPEPANGKGLSSVERSAFREIGERLKRASDIVAVRQQQASSAEAGDSPVDQKNGEATSAEISAYAEAAAAESAEHAVPEAAPAAPAADQPGEGAEVVVLSSVRPGVPEVEQAEAAVERAEQERPPLRTEDVIPSFAGGRNTHVDAPILEQLPVPVLIHAGDLLHYANAEFLALTGYGTVDELAEAGGLDALFAESYGRGGGRRRPRTPAADPRRRGIPDRGRAALGAVGRAARR